MAATIEQLLVNNPNWSYAEIGVAYVAWDAAIKYAEAKFTSTNKQSTPCCETCSNHALYCLQCKNLDHYFKR
jgi:hypothetical protein